MIHEAHMEMIRNIIMLRNKLVIGAVRTISLSYNNIKAKMGIWDQYSFIRDGLWLGTLPTIDGPIEEACDFDTKLIESISDTTPHLPLKLVVSVVEENELKGDGFAGITTVSPERWKELGIEHQLLQMEDFTANVDLNQAVKVVTQIIETMNQGYSVYVHCKAGRSRSAMIEAVVLALTTINENSQELLTLNEAIDFLKSKRKQVSIGSKKRETAKQIIQHFDRHDLLEQMQTGVPAATALASFSKERKHWLLSSMTDDDFKIYFPNQEMFDLVLKEIALIYRIYVIDKFTLLVDLLYQDKFQFTKLMEDCQSWKLQHMQNAIGQLITILNDPAWEARGLDWMGAAKLPSGIEKMREICKQTDYQSLSLTDIKLLMQGLAKQFNVEDTKESNSSSLLSTFWKSSQVTRNVTRNGTTKRFYQLINQMKTSFTNDDFQSIVYLDQLDCFYQASLRTNETHVKHESHLSRSL